ncbi:hypothetical protein [Marinimicrobium sp. ARAG 43.8]|uniref:hypothetical protein n=1 Tax=Marinimicrobium sp. ARAG 43.8 TaxID=3418719 RepID=UPI003CF54885
MSSHFIYKTFKNSVALTRRPLAVRSGLIAVAFIGGFALSPSGVASDEEWTKETFTMVGVKNYFWEICREFTAGDVVSYRSNSAYPIDFNIHYHPGKETKFKLKKEGVSEVSGSFTPADNQHYCFTWTSTEERGENWLITLEYQAVSN